MKNTSGFLGLLHIQPLTHYLRDPLCNNAIFLIATNTTSARILAMSVITLLNLRHLIKRRLGTAGV